MLSTSRVAGWGLDLSSPGMSVTARIDVDGTPGTPFTANLPRPDVAATFKAPGNYGFDQPLALSPGEHRIDVVLFDLPTNTPDIIASKIVFTPPPSPLPNAAGSIDVLNATQIAGWAWYAPLVGSSATIVISIDNLPALSAQANLGRPDLNNTFGPGNFGYSLSLPALTPGKHTVTLQILDPITYKLTTIMSQALSV